MKWSEKKAQLKTVRHTVMFIPSKVSFKILTKIPKDSLCHTMSWHNKEFLETNKKNVLTQEKGEWVATMRCWSDVYQMGQL